MSTGDQKYLPGLKIDGFYLSGDRVNGWRIAWRDKDAGTEMFLPTVYGCGGSGDSVWEAAQALKEHADRVRRAIRLSPEKADLQNLLTQWLDHHTANLSRFSNYKNSVSIVFQFLENQRAKGYLLGAMMVTNLNSSLVKRFIEWRLSTGVCLGTVESDLAALRSCLNWAKQSGYLETFPVIMKAQKERGRSTPAVSYTLPEIGRILNAAIENPGTYHVVRTLVIILFTLARVEAVLAARTCQRRGDFFDFCLPGDRQTAKVRRLAYLGETVRPWFDMPAGKLIQYDEFGFQRLPKSTAVHPRSDTSRIGKPFDRVLVQAGILRPGAYLSLAPDAHLMSAQGTAVRTHCVIQS